MNNYKKILVLAFTGLIFNSCAIAQEETKEKVNQEVVNKIKKEAQENSKALDNLNYIADVHGPRITGSPQYYEAAKWAKNRMQKWGLDAKLDDYENNLRGWHYESYSVQMTAPSFMTINALPYIWSGSTSGVIESEIVLINPNDIDELKKYIGKLKGKIILSPENEDVKDVDFKLFSDAQLEKASKSTLANDHEGLDNSGIPPFAEMLKRRSEEGGESEDDIIHKFLIEQGVEAVVTASRHGLGIVSANTLPYNAIGDIKPVAHFSIAKDQHSRLLRLIEKGYTPKLKLHLKTKFNTEAKYHVNILADFKGEDPALKDEIVMVGAHFDSKVGGTGAADNGAGSATIMEAVRILKAIGIKPRRTIRIALWDGEEEGLKGSLGYLKKYVGDILKGTTKEQQSKISVYFNMDQNGHDLRGIFAQGNTKIRPIFDAYLKPFHEYGANTTTIQNACCTDHLGFDALGIPAFEWIYDPLYYFSHQLHVSTDMSDLVKEDSMKRNAAIVAGFIYHAAMRDEMLPRK
ncbi:M20/M25/M40 family metallo-hydrolase [Maribacter antarcticus]|uniref:M20/M25/M40 family metallo-hydrolase n=1 Tax=Maribacter antarcticus TaxID=505250 RepID=UPI0006852E18|nr:M20/M25/M40 family metallo-hydrolase [Maribacter antarcticus]